MMMKFVNSGRSHPKSGFKGRSYLKKTLSGKLTHSVLPPEILTAVLISRLRSKMPRQQISNLLEPLVQDISFSDGETGLYAI